MDRDIETIMLEISALDNPHIFSVDLQKRDYCLGFTAYATIRGTGTNYSASSKTAKEALENLENVLKTLICPHCGQLIEKKEKE